MTKRIAFFAHYDRDGMIDEYVLHYLRGLRTVADEILFVSDCDLPKAETDKLQGLAKLVSAGRHREHDFGSWKRCFEHLNYDFSKWDELVLANDSCYAPIFPFGPAFSRMEKEDFDFWGAIANEEDGKFNHLSSYFLVFRKPVLLDAAFRKFWEGIVRQRSVTDVINFYERGLTALLVGRGYRWASQSPIAETCSFLTTDYISRTLTEYQCCWLKVRLVRDNPLHIMKLGERLSVIEPYYPRQLIDSHLFRMLGTIDPHHYHFRHKMTSPYHLKFGVFEISSKIKRKREGRLFTWWKVYFYMLHVPFFALAIPLHYRKKPAMMMKLPQ